MTVTVKLKAEGSTSEDILGSIILPPRSEYVKVASGCRSGANDLEQHAQYRT